MSFPYKQKWPIVTKSNDSYYVNPIGVAETAILIGIVFAVIGIFLALFWKR